MGLRPNHPRAESYSYSRLGIALPRSPPNASPPQNMRLLPALLLLLLLCTCGRAPESEAEGEAKAFFDLAGYIANEVERLEGQPTTARKTITLNGVTEEQEIDDLDYGQDLRLFAGADINKAAWVEKYQTQTEELSGTHTVTRYVALDTTLTTQLLEVEEDRGEPLRIYIERRTGTVLSEGRNVMEYIPREGYSVITQQDNRFGSDVDAEVRVRWQ